MNAELKEFLDANGNVCIAIIWVTALPFNNNQMNLARGSLNNYISNYVGNRGHNIYMHTQNDTVSAVITFDLNNLNGTAIQI
jgi:hypothetical protein